MSLARLHTTDMENGDIIDGDDLKDELDQLVNALNGTSNIDIIIKQSHATLPPLLLNQISSGPIAKLQQNSSDVARITNSGAYEFVPGTGAPFITASTTKAINFNADLLDGLDSSAFGILSTHKTRWLGGWFYAAVPPATESTESVHRIIVPSAISGFQIIDIVAVWASGADSGGSNIFTIKRRNSAGVAQTDVGTIDINTPAQNVVQVTTLGAPLTLTAGDQIYPLLTTRNTGSETIITIGIRGVQLLAS